MAVVTLTEENGRKTIRHCRDLEEALRYARILSYTYNGVDTAESTARNVSIHIERA